MRGPRPDLEYHYAGAGGRWIAKHLRKIAIQRDERSPFTLAYFEQPIVCRPPQFLTGNRNGIVAAARTRSAARRLRFSSSLNFTPRFQWEQG
jgi:hypothetical protein